MPDQPQLRLGVVGGGRRASFFLRLARMATDRYDIVGVTSRSVQTRQKVSSSFRVPCFESVDQLLDAQPDLVLIAVSWTAVDAVVRHVAGAGVRVLVETPPAPDLAALRRLWADVGGTGLVQVAEQSMAMPSHEAKLSAVRTGLIGEPTAVHVSSNHGYHAVAIMRALLGIGFEPAAVRATTFSAPLVHPLLYDEWQRDAAPQPATTVVATLDFGSSMGLYDFTDLQWFNPVRHRRLVIRGTHGEIDGDSVLRLSGCAAVPSSFVRRYTGVDMNHEGFDLDHISLDGHILFRNPYRGQRLSDEDIAALSLLDSTAAWARGEGAAPYPLAHGSQDHLIALAINEAAKLGTTVTTSREAWACDGQPRLTKGQMPR